MKQKLLIFGGSGLVGSKFIDLFQDKYEITAPEIDDLDILDKDKLFQFVKSQQAELVVNYAAFTNVDKAEEEKDNKEGLVYKINTLAVKDLSEICNLTYKKIIQYSTDYIFDGTKNESPYLEEDKPNPINWYGETKNEGEKFILESGVQNTIIRISMPYSAKYNLKKDIIRFFLEELQNGREIIAIDDQFVTPVLVDDAAFALDAIISNQAKGIFHTVSSSSITPFELTRLIADKFGFNKNLVKRVKLEKYNETRTAKRLKYAWLSVEKFKKRIGSKILHNIEEDIDIFRKQIVSSKY